MAGGGRKKGDDVEAPLVSAQKPAEADESRSLAIAFVLMVLIGLGNKIFQKLETIPMHNYANSLNLMTTFFYIPMSFAYVLPMIKWGSQITPEQRAVPMRDFAVMGFLDCLAGIMQIFASTYLDGTLLILLGQAAIPISMVISKLLLNEQYKLPQYVGAGVVAAGITVVLGPRLGGGGSEPDGSAAGAADDLSNFTSSVAGHGEWDYVGDAAGAGGASDLPADCGDGGDNSSGQILLWAMVMIFSCVPMTLSSVYKEKALGETDLDPVYLNGWIAVWQFLFSIPLAIPAAMVSVPAVEPHMLWTNLVDGLKCYAGIDSITSEYRDSNPEWKCFEEDDCASAPAFVSIYLVFNIGQFSMEES